MKLKAKTTDAVTSLEQAGQNLARTIAQSGMVLLQNNGVLPMQKGNIALYGSGARHTVTGGSGSGEVNARYTVSFEEGLQIFADTENGGQTELSVTPHILISTDGIRRVRIVFTETQASISEIVLVSFKDTEKQEKKGR